jgi:hypothetical protein
MRPAGCVNGLLADRYRLDERIAVGGMGEVWRGEDTVLGRPVAVKCLKPEYADDAEFRARFRNEARHAAGLSHPGIASVYDYGEQVDPEKAAWLVLELVDGEPLSALLHRTGRLPVDQALDVVGQAALGLQAAHEAGVVHRDVKPGNLLVRPDGAVKVTDFGIAWAADAVPLTQTGTVVGTAYYLSPEQAAGKPVTPASDVYSLGVVAYECLAGTRPFPGNNPLAVAQAHLQQPPPPLPADVPPAVAALVLRALEKDPARRPACAADLAREAFSLRAATAATSPHTMVLPVTEAPAQPPAAAPVPGRPHNHRRAVRLASAALAVVVVALSVRACTGTSEVVVPAVAAGTSVAAASAQLGAAHLDAFRVTHTSTTVLPGRVIGTDPPAGTKVKKGGAVTLVVSSGRPKVMVTSSSYAGKSASTVRAALLGLGLAPVLAYDGAGTPAGTVSSVTPTGSLTYGATVTVHVVPVPLRGDPGRGKKKHGEHD